MWGWNMDTVSQESLGEEGDSDMSAHSGDYKYWKGKHFARVKMKWLLVFQD
jgi:hypothetical protein